MSKSTFRLELGPTNVCDECDKCDERVCIGSYEELEKSHGKKLPKSFDPHLFFINTITANKRYK